MADFHENACRFTGNVTRDVEVRSKTVARFGLATSKRVKEDDKWVDKTTFINVVAFGERHVATLERFVQKGTKITIEAEYVVRDYEKDGQPQKSHEFHITPYTGKIVLHDRLKKASEGPQGAPRAATPGGGPAGGEEDDSGGQDVPF